ncbi:MAG: NAD-dependent succinate-semialdehyde dehydrogenase [Candidatus Eremiobacteraeota bacterium]|nr:NAD-dependent succinate-semialdehyde dehydrogenase [Candidatus Eremiobacteraeota bacterium]
MAATTETDIFTVNPSDGSPLERISVFGSAQVDGVLDRARDFFGTWRAVSFERRRTFLLAYAKALREQSESLASTAVREMGKPIAQARAEIEKCAACCDFFAVHGARFIADRVVETDATLSYVAFRPLGVILAVMPWNFPYWQVVRAFAPAVAAGNVVVLKHASNTTRCGLELERLTQECGAGGALQTLILPNDRIAEIVSDPRIAAVTLTGSEGAGISVAKAAGAVLKKCVLELGGSDPFIVLADADIDKAVETAVKARFQNAGQSCIAAKRFIIEAPAYDRFVESFARASAAQRVGDPFDDLTQVGPCARGDLRDALQKQIDASRARGARIVTGGRHVERPGFYFEPTVVADVTPGMPMFDEETFGPAAAVVKARDESHAVELANDTPFGLGSNIWSRDIPRARRIAERIEAGSAFVNGMVASDPRLPFGGIKRSGYGRELSEYGIHEFTNVQTVWIGPARDGHDAR